MLAVIIQTVYNHGLKLLKIPRMKCLHSADEMLAFCG